MRSGSCIKNIKRRTAKLKKVWTARREQRKKKKEKVK